jgi:hypothetical protein
VKIFKRFHWISLDSNLGYLQDILRISTWINTWISIDKDWVSFHTQKRYPFMFKTDIQKISKCLDIYIYLLGRTPKCLQQEQIELHKLGQLIKSHSGIILGNKIDAIIYVFPENEFPFDLVEDIHFNGHYWYQSNKCRSIQLNTIKAIEYNKNRLKNSKMQETIRIYIYIYIYIMSILILNRRTCLYDIGYHIIGHTISQRLNIIYNIIYNITLP